MVVFAGGDDFGLHFGGHFLVVGERFAVGAAAGGDGAEVAGVTVEAGLGDLGGDDLEVALGFDAEDAAAAGGNVGHDVADGVFGHGDAKVEDGFEQAGFGIEEGLLEGGLAGDLEGDVLGIDGVLFAVEEIDFDIDDRTAGEDAFGAGGLHAFLDGGDEHAVHVVADERVGELDAGVAGQWFDAHPDFGELTCSAGLFLVAVA